MPKIRNALLLASSALMLNACTSTAPIEQKQAEAQTEVIAQPKAASALPSETLQAMDQQQLKRLLSNAAANQDWQAYLIYNQQLWVLSNDKQQADLEEQAWSIISSLNSAQIMQLQNSRSETVQAWLDLKTTLNQQNSAFDLGIINLQSFSADASFHKHLLPRLLEQRQQLSGAEQIAVLLPFDGKYKIVSNQIRNGIVKAYLASNQQATIRFYDSTDLANIQNLYSQAKLDGATRIIGPLRKQAIKELAGYQDASLVALNEVENSQFVQFSFLSANPSQQMLDKLQAANYERIGIMTTDNKKSLADAQQLQYLWQQLGHKAQIHIYPDSNPRLRKALGALINEDASIERKNNLRWMLGQNLDYFPRTRQDLDALVVFDNEQRMAVFRPQLDFFTIDMPILGSSALTPSDFQHKKINADMKDVRFLTYPAVLQPVDLSNKFEAFGWDSFLVSRHLNNLRDGACLTDGKTGILSLDDNRIRQKYVWAQYSKRGELNASQPLPIKQRLSTEAETANATNTEQLEAVTPDNNAIEVLPAN
ncbi:penicillin-binding protein activator [Thiomicrorhabdus sediminis]|nr:penicillin-binding protein activator [Thiomicrorhabdus sediminis]